MSVALRASMCSFEMGVRILGANARSMLWPGRLLKSTAIFPSTTSTVLMRPKPQLLCIQKPSVAICTRVSTSPGRIFPVAASFSNSSFIGWTTRRPTM